MSALADRMERPKNNRDVLLMRSLTWFVRFLTWLAVALFLVAFFLLMPRGITVFWPEYLLIYGTVIVVDLAAILSFVMCRLLQRNISFAYLVISSAVMAAVCYDTWFELRLRWYEVF